MALFSILQNPPMTREEALRQMAAAEAARPVMRGVGGSWEPAPRPAPEAGLVAPFYNRLAEMGRSIAGSPLMRDLRSGFGLMGSAAVPTAVPIAAAEMMPEEALPTTPAVAAGPRVASPPVTPPVPPTAPRASGLVGMTPAQLNAPIAYMGGDRGTPMTAPTAISQSPRFVERVGRALSGQDIRGAEAKRAAIRGLLGMSAGFARNIGTGRFDPGGAILAGMQTAEGTVPRQRAMAGLMAAQQQAQGEDALRIGAMTGAHPYIAPGARSLSLPERIALETEKARLQAGVRRIPTPKSPTLMDLRKARRYDELRKEGRQEEADLLLRMDPIDAMIAMGLNE